MSSSAAATDPAFSNLARQANKLMDQMQKGFFSFCPGEAWTPNVNLYETDESYLVCVDLAGVDKEKIDLELIDNRLTLRGARAVPTCAELGENGNGNAAAAASAAGEHGREHGQPQQHQEAAGQGHGKRVRIHLMEIDHGAFCREVELPQDVVREKITANYRNGMLWIEIPRS